MYNALRNFVMDDGCGILYIEFGKGYTLQMAENTELLFDQTSQEGLQKVGETGRYWLFRLSYWVLILLRFPLRAPMLKLYPVAVAFGEGLSDRMRTRRRGLIPWGLPRGLIPFI